MSNPDTTSLRNINKELFEDIEEFCKEPDENSRWTEEDMKEATKVDTSAPMNFEVYHNRDSIEPVWANRGMSDFSFPRSFPLDFLSPWYHRIRWYHAVCLGSIVLLLLGVVVL